LPSYVLVIDQGTTSPRVMLFRADPSVAAVAQREFPQHFPADGEVEHEPEDLWATTVETCRSALRDAGARAADIADIGIASTIGRMARGTPNSASSSAHSRPAASPIAWRGEDRRSGSRRAAAAPARKQPARTSCSAQPYNVVTRWRSVSLGLY
jgi:glycerol kinase